MREPDGGECPACGRLVAGRLRGGLCPACLLDLALHEADGDQDDPASTQCPPDYRILTVLSGDGARTIYLAQQEGGRSLVTLEVVRAAAAIGMTPRLFHERLSAMRRLSHPCIARILDGRVTAEGDYCLVADYVPGQPADRYAEAAAALPGDLPRVFEQVCEAVAYAHGKGVVHGRLRPSAVVLTTGNGALVPRLTGFSVCERLADASDDVRGLVSILVVMAGRVRLPAAFDAVVRRAGHGVASEEFPSVGALRDAVAAAAQNR